jgi:hypothetical protein
MKRRIVINIAKLPERVKDTPLTGVTAISTSCAPFDLGRSKGAFLC